MRLADRRLWPIPVTLDVPLKIVEEIFPGQAVALRGAEGMFMAVLTVSEIWQPDRGAEPNVSMEPDPSRIRRRVSFSTRAMILPYRQARSGGVANAS
ncbi:MAG TPA: hypothetical protein VIR61_01425 [Sulfuricaulis sp.]